MWSAVPDRTTAVRNDWAEASLRSIEMSTPESRITVRSDRTFPLPGPRPPARIHSPSRQEMTAAHPVDVDQKRVSEGPGELRLSGLRIQWQACQGGLGLRHLAEPLSYPWRQL